MKMKVAQSQMIKMMMKEAWSLVKMKMKVAWSQMMRMMMKEAWSLMKMKPGELCMLSFWCFCSRRF